jgi:PAS domain-containing protein
VALATLSMKLRFMARRLRLLAAHNESLVDRNWELQEAEQHARHLFEAQGDLIVIRDACGRISFANDAYCKLAARSRDALLGSAFTMDVQEQGEMATEPNGTRIHDQKIATPQGPRWIAWREGLVRANVSAATSPIAPNANARSQRRAILPTPPTTPNRASWRWPATRSARR